MQMAVSKEELIDALSNLKVLEVVDLVKALEEKWPLAVLPPRRPPRRRPNSPSP
jgi:large subunit ribosomal protein L7/L12